MALVLKADVTISDDGTQLFIEFLEATGTYDEENNPGGFGAPNPARNALAIILFAEHKVAGDVAATVLAYSPLSVSSFTVTMTKEVNGVLAYTILALPIFAEEGDYDDGDVVYDNTNPAAPFIKEMVEGVFVERTAEEIVGNATVTQKNAYSFPIPDAIALQDELAAEKLRVLRDYLNGKCKGEDYKILRDRYEFVEALLISGTNAFCAAAYNEAQIDLEEIFTFESEVLDNE